MSSVKVVRSREGSVVVVRRGAVVRASALLAHERALRLAALVCWRAEHRRARCA